MGCLETGLIIAAVLFALYKYLTKNDDYFKKRGIKFEKPTFVFGNMLDVFIGKENGISIYHKFYNMFRSEKIWGMFIFTRPVFFVRDAEVIKHIMVKKFDHFLNHDSNLSKHGDRYFARSLLHLESDHWREMRTALTPIFTSAKLKTMYHHLTSCAQQLTEYLDEEFVAEGNLVIEPKEIFGRFTSEAIATIFLGLQGNCLKDENSEIHKLQLNIQADQGSLPGVVKVVLVPVFPTLAKLFGVKIFRQSVQDFFKNYVSGEMARREREGVTGNKDVIQLLIQAKKEQQSNEKNGKTTITDWNDEELLAAQVFILSSAGFYSTSTATQMMSWELAKNQEVQQTLIEEVDEVLATMEGNEVSYEALNKMKFLDMVINEVLRKWPPFSLGQRECNKDCRIETDDGKVIEFKKDDMIIVPVHPMHYDSKYYQNPYKFDPTRWSDENKQNIVPGSFMTFGLGPRMCLGSRLALIEIKLAFFTVLRKYKIEVCSQTPEKVTHSLSPLVLKDRVFVQLKPRKQ